MTPHVEARFWALVRKGHGPDDCWEWTGGRWKRQRGERAGQSTYGYFKIKTGGVWQRYKAHRIAYLLAHGRFPSNLACHTCDNEGCVRPDHIFDGTHADNSADMCAKGRQSKGDRTSPERRARGSRNGVSRLTEPIVAQLIARYQQGESIPALAASVGVERQTVWSIIRGKRWTHVERPADLRRPSLGGESHGTAKLTAGQVREIRRRRSAGERPDALAAEFGVHRVYVYAIARRAVWGWLTDDESTAAD